MTSGLTRRLGAIPKPLCGSAYGAVEMVHSPRLVLSGVVEQLLSQEGTDILKRLLSGPQNEVGGEDMNHALPRMDLYSPSRGLKGLTVAN